LATTERKERDNTTKGNDVENEREEATPKNT
jgi:hypothetical protein